eukprot:CAMPEP_0197592928 /NCGR_PEP_ID=MMETSP1326-20131121/16488_1 /TAXON_ID=1155430 /ORGANISM="Genus nov. species nov., Strain RCC2288" /LENGTH=64 /DNA_ID=CAMNT_0043158759 /DNA_START=236 /DNA_END=427 /DNA_ORIENTATION=+
MVNFTNPDLPIQADRHLSAEFEHYPEALSLTRFGKYSIILKDNIIVGGLYAMVDQQLMASGAVE